MKVKNFLLFVFGIMILFVALEGVMGLRLSWDALEGCSESVCYNNHNLGTVRGYCREDPSRKIVEIEHYRISCVRTDDGTSCLIDNLPYIKFEAEPCPENGNYSLPEIGDGHIGDYAPGANSIDGWPLWESIGIFEFRVCAVSCPESDGSVFISGNGTCILLPVSCMPYYNITIGDANKDFSVDIGDIITILTHLYNKGQAARICIDAADMNGDGFVDILDVMLLMEEVFKSQ